MGPSDEPGRLMRQFAEWADDRSFRSEDGSIDYWRALAAGEIAATLDMGGDLAEQLVEQTFETSLGPVSFDAGRYWTGEPYGLYVSRSGDFVPLTEDRQ